jgi:hypothetical protein
LLLPKSIQNHEARWRGVAYFNVTEHPTAQWTGQQIIEAFPRAAAPKYLLRDRDAIYGSQFKKRVRLTGCEMSFRGGQRFPAPHPETSTGPRESGRHVHRHQFEENSYAMANLVVIEYDDMSD